MMMMMMKVDWVGWLAITMAVVMVGVWAVRATLPNGWIRVTRALAQARRVIRHGLRRDVMLRRVVWGLAFLFLVIVWNGRRVVNAVIVPFWGWIRHYVDLQAALLQSLLTLVIFAVA
jgi:hypothetical protein